MSVQLTPIDFINPERGEDDDIPDNVSIANGTWRAITAVGEIYSEDIKMWNGCHDPVRYTPAQLRALAERIDQIKDAGEWLRWLADNGGAELS